LADVVLEMAGGVGWASPPRRAGQEWLRTVCGIMWACPPYVLARNVDARIQLPPSDSVGRLPIDRIGLFAVRPC